GYSSFNLGNTTRSVVVAVSGNITQSTGGIITETGTGIQQLLLNGASEQQINIKGQINNQVIFARNSVSNARLLSSLSLPYILQLTKGNIISTEDNLLIIQSGCSIKVDSLSDLSFIDGPLKKLGLANSEFLFPIGTSGKMRWASLSAATGNYTVEYNRSNPRIISNSYASGIDHISAIEYWKITGDGTATVKLSFNDPGSGGVTDLSHLRVARLQNNIWQNTGNTDFRGTPGSNGWVSSSAASGFSAENNFFALASANSQENPLPIIFLAFKVSVFNNEILFNWKVGKDHSVTTFELQESNDNKQYRTIYSCKALAGLTDYSYSMHSKQDRAEYYRVKAMDIDGSAISFSKINYLQQKENSLTMNTVNVANNLNMRVMIKETRRVEFVIYNTLGQLLKKLQMDVYKGTTNLTIMVNDLPSGVYTLSMMGGGDQLATFQF
ncbi:MAG: T9SS type A sorting domain-containing protein, partial [Chitinophagaceae bacterium]|nr:T9SS type A sorting domain-containing protein [Chitinophagaceae bacterium]